LGLECFSSFNGLISSGSALLLQPDGRVLIAGYFGDEEGWIRLGLARLKTNGLLDEDFTPVFSYYFETPVVRALALEPDGQVFVGGIFNLVDGMSSPGLARLNGGVLKFVFLSLTRLPTGRVRLNFAMPRGQNWHLQASTDLATWLDLDGGPPLRDSTEFTDPTANTFETRFYRALPLR
jgi:hypothetical protein